MGSAGKAGRVGWSTGREGPAVPCLCRVMSSALLPEINKWRGAAVTGSGAGGWQAGSRLEVGQKIGTT